LLLKLMDAVILDVGGVLLVPHFESVGAALEPLGIALDEDGAERAHYFGIRAMDAAGENESEARHAYLVGYAHAAGVPDEKRNQALVRMRQVWGGPTIDLWRQHVRGSVEGLRRLKERKIRLGIVSNADGTIEEQLRRGQICQVGDGLGVPVLAIIDSHNVGVEKPAADIFRHALEPLGVAAEQALYVGDTVRYDVRGARAAGLTPVHFDPYGLCPEREDHAHVARLGDLAAATPRTEANGRGGPLWGDR
jgi:putative hydrolase of the HAD superfamily